MQNILWNNLDMCQKNETAWMHRGHDWVYSALLRMRVNSSNLGCVPIPRTHPSKAAFEGCVDADCVTATRQVLSQFQGSFKCGLRMQPSFPGFEGCIGCILHGPTYPKILHGPTYPSQDSLRTQSMEMAENGDLSSAFKCKYLVSSHSSI